MILENSFHSACTFRSLFVKLSIYSHRPCNPFRIDFICECGGCCRAVNALDPRSRGLGLDTRNAGHDCIKVLSKL